MGSINFDEISGLDLGGKSSFIAIVVKINLPGRAPIYLYPPSPSSFSYQKQTVSRSSELVDKRYKYYV